MTMIEAVIFDIDGTLVDSNDLHAASWKETFLQFGKDVPYSDLRQQIGKGADQYMPEFWNEKALGRFGKEMERFREQLFFNKYLKQAKPFPKAKELLERIRRDGKQVALASSSKKAVVDYYIELLGIQDLINARTSADEARRSKPFPDIFSAVLGDLEGATADKSLVVGDAPYDAQAGHKLGMGTIAFLCGGFSKEELQEAGAIAVYNDPADLLIQYDASPIVSSAPYYAPK